MKMHDLFESGRWTLLSGINNMIQDICPRLWSELYDHSLQVYILDFYFFLAQICVPKRPLRKKKKKKKKSTQIFKSDENSPA